MADFAIAELVRTDYSIQARYPGYTASVGIQINDHRGDHPPEPRPKVPEESYQKGAAVLAEYKSLVQQLVANYRRHQSAFKAVPALMAKRLVDPSLSQTESVRLGATYSLQPNGVFSVGSRPDIILGFEEKLLDKHSWLARKAGIEFVLSQSLTTHSLHKALLLKLKSDFVKPSDIERHFFSGGVVSYHDLLMHTHFMEFKPDQIPGESAAFYASLIHRLKTNKPIDEKQIEFILTKNVSIAETYLEWLVMATPDGLMAAEFPRYQRALRQIEGRGHGSSLGSTLHNLKTSGMFGIPK